MTPSPAVSITVPFLVHLLFLFVEHGLRSPFFSVFPSAIKLLSSSNNGSRGFTPQTTPKMISLSEDILFVVDLGYLEPFLGIVLLTRRCETSGPMCLFRNVREALDTNVNIPPHPPTPPLTIIQQHMQPVPLPCATR